MRNPNGNGEPFLDHLAKLKSQTPLENINTQVKNRTISHSCVNHYVNRMLDLQRPLIWLTTVLPLFEGCNQGGTTGTKPQGIHLEGLATAIALSFANPPANQ